MATKEEKLDEIAQRYYSKPYNDLCWMQQNAVVSVYRSESEVQTYLEEHTDDKRSKD